jgi:hypothetical protein
LCVLWSLFIGKVAWSPKHIGPSTSLFFVNFDFSYFFVFLKASNINVDSTRKISDCKINALKVERVQNTFENLNSSKMTLKMLKWCAYIKNAFFGVFIVLLLFLVLSKNLSKTWIKNWVATR